MPDTWRQKKYKKWVKKISYDHLPDEVHADQELQNHIFKKVGNVLCYHITSKPVKTSQGEESPKGSDKWEHKRQHTA